MCSPLYIFKLNNVKITIIYTKSNQFCNYSFLDHKNNFFEKMKKMIKKFF